MTEHIWEEIMNATEFPGSRWWKFDFHNHTPASSDFDSSEIHTLQPRDWLLAYMRKGIDCVAVTDHNTSGWIEKLQTTLRDMASEVPISAEYRPLVLFPGVEITTSDSFHILALFSPDVGSSILDGLLVGKLNISNTGKPTAELMVSESASTVIDKIHELNGLAIAAHVEKDHGLLQGSVDVSGSFKPNNSGRSIDDVLPKLDALEFQGLNNDCYQHFANRLNGKALVCGSDWPHNTTNAGSRFAWIKMSQPSFDGLRLALLDPESAVRRSDQAVNDPQPLPQQWIKSITLESMHLRRPSTGSLTLDFNPAYNAVIGGRGSGKSTLLECLRLALAREYELKKLGEDTDIWKTFDGFQRQYTQRDKPGMMLPETKISAEVIKGQGELSQRFKFIWCKQSDGRFSVRVMRWDENAWQETGLDEKQAGELFPVKVFSQKQILALANNPQALLEHIDNSIRDAKNAWLENFEKKKNDLLAAKLRVRTLKKELEKKPQVEMEYKEASRKARVFSNANFGPLLKAHQRAMQQQRALDDFYQFLANDVSELKIGIQQAANLSSTELTSFLTESPEETTAYNDAILLKEKLVKQYEQIVSSVSTMQAEIDAAQAARVVSVWHQENQKHIQAYQSEAARLKDEGINSAQDAALAVSAEERLRQQLEQIKKFEEELEQAEIVVEKTQQVLIECREELTQIRAELVNRLLVKNDMLKIELRSMASAKNEVARFREILRLGSGDTFAAAIWQEQDDIGTTGILWDVVDVADSGLISGRLIELKQALEEINEKRHDAKILNTTLRADLVRRIEGLPSQAFDELACWFPEDEVRLEYRPKKGAPYKSINQASAGQKTAAMLSFLLVHGDEPLLLDQPEDDLDNALVTELVVEQLRKNKVNRQLLVVTHNANIVVNADAELVVTMEFDRGQIKAASIGGLQETIVRQDICRVMEGGEEAFRQRYKRILKDLEVK